jgi:hypothetical protein
MGAQGCRCPPVCAPIGKQFGKQRRRIPAAEPGGRNRVPGSDAEAPAEAAEISCRKAVSVDRCNTSKSMEAERSEPPLIRHRHVRESRAAHRRRNDAAT